MKKFFMYVVALALCITTLTATCLTASAAVNNPYGVTSVGCITDIDVESNVRLHDGADYFNATVTSYTQGLESRMTQSYKTYGAIGLENTKMFVYSVGAQNGLDYAGATVKSIVEAFEKENPQWKAVAAVNGDFFDMENKITASMYETESPMIQMGKVYKSALLNATGRGVVGINGEGKTVYYTFGSVYSENGYGTAFTLKNHYSLQLLGEHRNNPIYSYDISANSIKYYKGISFITTDSPAINTSGSTVFVVKCDTYRRSHVGINGQEMGTTGYFFEGEITEIRNGKASDAPEEGYVLLYTNNPEKFGYLEVGGYVRCQKELVGEWEGVENAVGFKQQILAEGNLLLKNCYGTYNTNADKLESMRWTEDIYDYPHCWKDRTAIGFKSDGTPVLLVIKKANYSASYYEIAEQLKALGCTNGFLLDGGGSSTMVIRDADGNLNSVVGGTRAVGNAVILAVRNEDVPMPEEDEPLTPPAEESTQETPTKGSNGNDKDQNASTEESNTSTEQSDEAKGCGSSLSVPALTVTAASAAVVTTLRKRKRK